MTSLVKSNSLTTKEKIERGNLKRVKLLFFAFVELTMKIIAWTRKCKFSLQRREKKKNKRKKETGAGANPTKFLQVKNANVFNSVKKTIP